MKSSADTGFVEMAAALAGRRQLLTHDSLAETFGAQSNVQVVKRDFLYKGGVWRGHEVRSAISSASGATVVVGHSDFTLRPIHAWILRKARPNVEFVWSSNLSRQTETVKSIPLGLTNFCDDSPVHRIFGDQQHIAEAVGSEFTEPRVYSNFDPKTAPRYRRFLHSYLDNLKTAVIGSIEISNKGRVAYLSDIRRFGFVICPRGNGIDTHRIFETLALGSVPILLSRDVPIWMKVDSSIPRIELRNWSQLSGLDLCTFLHLRESIELTSLTSNYWSQKIKSISE
jgi:hypothetical protein